MAQDKDKIGYCRPPAETQFKKGKSGNPKGRPKGKVDFLNLLGKEFGEIVNLSNGDRLSKMSCMVKGMVNDAVKGDFRKQKLSIGVLEKLEGKSLAEKFLLRFLKEGYITEEDAKDYAKNKANPNFNYPDEVIGKIHQNHLLNKRSAHETAFWMDRVVSLYNSVGTCLWATTIMTMMEKEYYFWEGVGSVFNLLPMSMDEKVEIISQLQKTRNFPFLTWELYHLSQLFYHKSLQLIKYEVASLKKVAEGTPLYHEAKERMYGHKNLVKTLDGLKDDPEKYKEFEQYIRNRYVRVRATESLDETIAQLEEGTEDLTEEDVKKLLEWLKIPGSTVDRLLKLSQEIPIGRG